MRTTQVCKSPSSSVRSQRPTSLRAPRPVDEQGGAVILASGGQVLGDGLRGLVEEVHRAHALGLEAADSRSLGVELGAPDGQSLADAASGAEKEVDEGAVAEVEKGAAWQPAKHRDDQRRGDGPHIALRDPGQHHTAREVPVEPRLVVGEAQELPESAQLGGSGDG